MEARKLDSYTTDFIESLPQGQRAELIDGYVYMMSSPSRTHQKIIKNLTFDIETHIRNNNGDCEVYPAPFAVYLQNDKRNYFEPDISVICDKNKLDEKGCHGAPDWIIEVASPSTQGYDASTKLRKYKETGVREYWIIMPEEERIFVHFFEHKLMILYKFGDKIPVNIYDGDLLIDTSTILI